ncbi:MAG: pyruvate dehydrogenase complex dihydrolipoamide acetyltransferase [Alphaproteobacteria bacterium]
MPIQVLMPALSPTMTEGTLAKWLKAEGDKIESGDIIAEVETDKATMEIEAIDDGVVGKILIAEGTEAIPINTPIAVILEEGEDASAMEGLASPSNGVQASEPAAESDPAPAPTETPPAAPVAAAPPPSAARKNGERIFASPLARRMAEQAGLDLAALSGSGPRGRIVKRDIEAAVAAGVSAPAATRAPVVAPAPVSLPADAAVTEVPNTNMRKVIAKRLSESKQTVPHFYLTIDCEIDRLLEMRKDLNGRSDAYRISVNDFVIRAVALALRKVPAANAVWTDAATLLYNTVDVSVAVAVDGGLITPVVRNADTKGLAAISAEMKDFAARAREGKLMPEEYQGGGFSVSNLGMFGIREFSAIINPPQSGILAIGAGEQRPVVKDGALAVATVMTCSLSGDHRVIDGAVGAEFLAAYKALIEDPLTMLL